MVEASPHLRNRNAYDEAWEAFIRKNPEPTRAQILEHGERLMKNKYGIEVNY